MAACDLNQPLIYLIDDSINPTQSSKPSKPANAANVPSANAPKKTKKRTYVKTTLQPVYVLPSSLPPTNEYEKIYGLEIKRAVESTLGIDEEYNSSRVECVQKHHGVYKIWLAENEDRYCVLTKGITLRGHHITTYGENPLSIDGQDAVRLKISNLDYQTSDEEVVKTLRSIGFLLASNVMYESFRDEKGKLLKTKSGHRFVFIARPTFPFSKKIEIGEDLNVYISYKGMENDTEQFAKAHDAEKESTTSDSNSSDTNFPSQGATGDAGPKLDEPSGPGHNSTECAAIVETAAVSKEPKQYNTASDEEQSDNLLTHCFSNQYDNGEETSKSVNTSSQSKNTAFSFMLPRGSQLQRSSSTPRVNPKSLRRITTDKTSTVDKKKNLTDRRRDSSLKRKNDNQTSYFDTGKRKNKETEKQIKENSVSFFSNAKKEVQRKLFTKENKPSDEHVLIANDIINEVLSRIKY